ncbi:MULTISPECIES: SDR family NAD(P)-dependent oxidoreductase [unclassified Lentilitoribacter]|uniref:SDR family NAD(P)-dependent oxidoreductase n=1 Tax=unclassified Lentilitoribacter TaxID=2647570 RepID=UPI0013A6A1F2|nr:SDR family oxidoreductase [Lentilitoribacter sp. Alg239-R112]
MAKEVQKLTLITGASSGIGLELAKCLEQTHRLILVGRRPLSDIDYSFAENVSYIQADFSNPHAAVQTISNALDAFGIEVLDHIVQCAGMGIYASPFDEELLGIGNTISVNLTFPILLTRELVSLLEDSAGKITLIGSIAHKGSPQMASYAASKAGLNGFARALQSEWQDRIGVQVIHPGPTLTPMLEKAGYKLGWEKHLFVPANVMASEIARLMQTRKMKATVFMGAKLKSWMFSNSQSVKTRTTGDKS